MILLYIIRHGIAVDRSDPKSPPDAERPLTAKGVQKTRSAALGLKALGAKPDVLVTSPLVRAAQTAEIFAEAIGFPPEKIQISENLKPNASAAETVKEFQRMKAKEVMCFGHGPHVDLLISYLAGSRGVFTGLKRAGVACFEQQSVHAKWELLWYVTPKILRSLGD
jgi:phosphohistidine phosphatase